MEIVLKNPAMLLGLLIIPILIILHYYFFEHNKKRAMKFANFSAMKRVTGTHLITKNTLQLVLRLIIFSMLILSSALPVVWYEGDASNTDYVLAIDASASMVSEDVLPDRLTVAKNSDSAFIDKQDVETNIGLITFSGVSFIKSPVTKDLMAVKGKIKTIEIELSGGTDIGGALVTATNLLMPSEKQKTIILLTDGSDTAGTFVDENVDDALEYVLANHVIVHTIGVGTGASAPGYLEDSQLKAIYGKDALKDIAERTGGKFYEVKSSSETAAAFNDIGGEVEKAKLYFELSPVFMTLGFILLLFEWGMLNTRWRALP